MTYPIHVLGFAKIKYTFSTFRFKDFTYWINNPFGVGLNLIKFHGKEIILIEKVKDFIIPINTIKILPGKQPIVIFSTKNEKYISCFWTSGDGLTSPYKSIQLFYSWIDLI